MYRFNAIDVRQFIRYGMKIHRKRILNGSVQKENKKNEPKKKRRKDHAKYKQHAQSFMTSTEKKQHEQKIVGASILVSLSLFMFCRSHAST